jgi:hypothetical protein
MISQPLLTGEAAADIDLQASGLVSGGFAGGCETVFSAMRPCQCPIVQLIEQGDLTQHAREARLLNQLGALFLNEKAARASFSVCVWAWEI